MGEVTASETRLCEAPIVLDSNGGTALYGPCGNRDQGRRLQIDEPRLRALDLHDDPHLEVLDLRCCGRQHYLHLQLDRLPRLSEIHLPRLVGGVILHLFSLELPGSLTINGNVSEIDADWQQGSLRLVQPRRCWERVQLLGHDARPADLSLIDKDGVPLTIVLGPALLQVMQHEGVLHLKGKGHVYLSDASPLQRLVVEGPSRVSIKRAYALRSLRLLGPMRFVGDQLDALEWVDAGQGVCREDSHEARPNSVLCQGYLTLRGQMPALTLADAWREVQLHAPRLERLSLGWATMLEMHHCGRLDSVNLPDGLPIDCHGTVPMPLLHVARFFIDEATLRQALTRLEAGEHSLLESVLTMLPQRAGAQSAFHGLTTLVRLAEQGFDAEALWQCRREIAAWQMIPQRRRRRIRLTDQDLARADGQWRWELPCDRSDEGVLADLRLWALCSKASSTAQAYRKILLTSRRERESFQLMVRFGSRPGTPEPIRSLMLEVLVKEYGSGEVPAWLEHHEGKRPNA
ncbi:hypothetical protein R5M92_03835 [Halomonas sp. Bachu 37]|uniref:hypothetical protein n=1 Tax=Halomonas kashgarensis TaxID=3084920 RepID=UPI00321682FB